MTIDIVELARRHKYADLIGGMVNRLADEVEKLRAENERLKQEPELLRAELIALTNAARKALSDAYDRARNAPEGRP